MTHVLIFALCGFASAFSMRIPDPVVLPVAQAFLIDPKVAALLSTFFALPYALSQPVLGPLGDRVGKIRLIQWCVTVLAVALALGTIAPSFGTLLATRVLSGMFAGGIIPLVMASIGDEYDMSERQVVISRFLVSVISGQMLGAAMAGVANDLLGWRSAFAIAALVASVASVAAWRGLDAHAQPAPPVTTGMLANMRALYAQVFANPHAPWLYLLVMAEGALFFGMFPFFGELLRGRALPGSEVTGTETGLVLGAFGIGGLAYAFSVRWILARLGMSRMVVVGAVITATSFAVLALPGPWWRDALAMLTAGVGFYMVHNSLQTMATELAPTARGSAVALFAASYFLGQALGPVLIGPLAHAAGFVAALLLIASGVLVVGTLVRRKLI
jgi:predicted MFS family arabinose efflux permease